MAKGGVPHRMNKSKLVGGHVGGHQKTAGTQDKDQQALAPRRRVIAPPLGTRRSAIKRICLRKGHKRAYGCCEESHNRVIQKLHSLWDP